MTAAQVISSFMIGFAKHRRVGPTQIVWATVSANMSNEKQN